MHRRSFIHGAAALALLAATAAQAGLAAPGEVATALPGARLQGAGQLRFLGLRVYDARLWAGVSAVHDDWAGQALALEIEYARELSGAAIAERSLHEMRRQGELDPATAARWLQTLGALLPDVRAGDRLTAVHRPGEGLRLFANGVLRGQVQEAALATRFFGIWLSPRTSQPTLRLALLGRAEP
jgi:hypothetical protein